VRNDALYFIAGKKNDGKRMRLEHDVFDVIAHVHDAFLHAGKNKTNETIR